MKSQKNIFIFTLFLHRCTLVHRLFFCSLFIVNCRHFVFAKKVFFSHYANYLLKWRLIFFLRFSLFARSTSCYYWSSGDGGEVVETACLPGRFHVIWIIIIKWLWLPQFIYFFSFFCSSFFFRHSFTTHAAFGLCCYKCMYTLFRKKSKLGVPISILLFFLHVHNVSENMCYSINSLLSKRMNVQGYVQLDTFDTNEIG